MNLFIITVNYSQSLHVYKLINTLEEISVVSSFNNINLVIVDYTSDVSVPQSCLIHIDCLILSNVGYLKGLKRGFNHISNLNPKPNDIVILCNPDIIFKKNLINTLLQNYSFIKSGLVAPDIICRNYRQNPAKVNRPSKFWYSIQSLEMFNFLSFVIIRTLKFLYKNFSLLIRRLKPSISYHENAVEIYLVHGSCMITTVNNIKKTNCLNLDLFLWGEEAFICHSFRESNLSITYCPGIKVLHDEHSSTKLLKIYKKYKIWKNSFIKYRKFL